MTGLLRVKNEARWIERCISSILPLCERVIVMDDHSTDETKELCAAMPGVIVFTSPFNDLNETRDKNLLLDTGVDEKGWFLMIDGDEMLQSCDVPAIRTAVSETDAVCLSPKILYLWDREDQARVDGVYGKFRRPSLFRAGSGRFQSTVFGGNFHCGNAPLAVHRAARPIDATLLHFGYMDREDRLRKYQFYNQNDPNNEFEDRYRHCVQGDIPEVPAWMKLRHAGPLQLVAIEEGEPCSSA
jgi:glycosyltransferase involved in cell wall biosynthesis